MPLKVTSVRAVPPFRLELVFSDESHGVFDCARLLEEPGSVAALRERAYFARVGLENGVPTWPNHYDISPEWLAEELARRGALHRPGARKARQGRIAPGG